MAGEIISPEGGAPAAPEPVAPIAIEASAPVAAAPEGAAPIVEQPAVAEVAAEPAAPAAVEAAPAAVAPIAEAGAVDPETPAEPVVEEPAKPVYTEFTLPEGLQAAPEQMEQFTSIAAELNLNQEQAQKLMDLHGAALKAVSDQLTQRQTDVFAETQANWQKDFFKSAGNRANTTLEEARNFVKTAIPDAKERAEFWQVMAFTGAGNHRAVIKAMAAGGRRLSERSAPAAPVPNSGGRGDAPWNKRYRGA